MLSRFALKGKTLVNPTSLKTLRLFSSTPTTAAAEPRRYPHDAAERDFVNFPAPRIPEHPSPVRIGFIPNEWFTAMYEKTGVTGPYLLFWGSLVTMLSKEIYVYWVDSLEHIVFFSVVVMLSKVAGPKIAAMLDKNVDAEEKRIKTSLESSLKGIDTQFAALEAQLALPEANSILHAAKRENVHLQLEGEYRKRIVQVHQETKKRLDYQVAIQNAVQRVEKGQMANYILSEVNKAVSATQEKEIMQSCLAQLKGIAQKHAGSI
jgi:F-type H+-transporting ATPase subunit b